MRYLFLTLLMIFGTLPAQEASSEASVNQKTLTASSEAAGRWLTRVDQEDYDQSWKSGSLTFKLTIPQKHWATLLKSIRQPLGEVLARKMLEQRESKNPKGLPKGDYMVLFYETSFSKKKRAHELVTMVQESDGHWRVLTYQVQ